MSDLNPYQPPSTVPTASAPAGAFIAEGRAVDAGRGWEWIAEGFAMFKRQPGMWILVLVVLVVCLILIGFVPLIGPLANALLMQVFMGGLMLGCRAVEDGQELTVAHVFAGFKQNTGDLVVLGLLAMIGWIIAFMPVIIIAGSGAFMALMRGGETVQILANLGMTFILALLVAMALSLLLYMALWFAPPLIVFNNLKPLDAMKASFYAGLKNMVPFLLYGVILLVLCFIAAIPFGLGYLVLGPVIIASIYTGYRDIFFAG